MKKMCHAYLPTDRNKPVDFLLLFFFNLTQVTRKKLNRQALIFYVHFRFFRLRGSTIEKKRFRKIRYFAEFD